MELRNQCRIIRTTELAAAQEKLNELERQKEELLRSCSPASLLQMLQEAMQKTDEESEALHRQFLDKEIDLGSFVMKYKNLRTTYHKRALIHLAAKASPTDGASEDELLVGDEGAEPWQTKTDHHNTGQINQHD
ncbi:hypothetical protein OIU84_010925 [Salix udensis]|uniref:VPS37 C-terminal domain-containing protein n=1 Tax=Salix udensis TaxID=889485 RepID=A0AAD6NWD5_9ROSI|nr:hypothetical protein OIU84_010925 [Salix udensis]